MVTAPQLVGWGAFVLGVLSFLQTSDQKFKQLMALECGAYVLHFLLLGHLAAAVSASVSLARSIAAIHFPFRFVGVVFMGASFVSGLVLSSAWVSWLPVMASMLGTFALFFLQSLPMRLVMLFGTSLWLLHNFWVESYGGVVLEAIVAAVNAVTLYKIWLRKDRTLWVEDAQRRKIKET